jgi:hypothetical protein
VFDRIGSCISQNIAVTTLHTSAPIHICESPACRHIIHIVCIGASYETGVYEYY